MLGRLDSLLNAAQLFLIRRRQFESLSLRRHFLKSYDIEIGLYSYGCFDRWRMSGPMRVGRYCSIASTVRTALMNHPTDALTTYPALYEKSFGVVDIDHVKDKPLIIEDDVWIGHNAIILAGCKHIGRGAVIGAGAIVTRDVAAYSIMAGNPAKKLRDRFEPELVAAIEASGWWKLSMAELGALVRKHPDMVFRPNVAHFQQWAGLEIGPGW